MTGNALLMVLLLAAPFSGTFEDTNVRFRLPISADVTAISSWFSHETKKYSCECNGNSCRSGHRGTDFAAPEGTDVFAAADGVVTATQTGCVVGDTDCGGGFGNFVRVVHRNGVRTTYGHLSKVLITQGETVDCGTLIGKVGTTGHSTGNHLHFEVETPEGDDLDPFVGACNPALLSTLWTEQSLPLPGSECDTRELPANHRWIGGSCDDTPSCGFSAALCLSDWPDGSCTQACERFCPDRDGAMYSPTFCIEIAGQGRCVSQCDDELYPNAGCRTGYHCETRARFGEPEVTRGVCVPDPQPEPEPTADAQSDTTVDSVTPTPDVSVEADQGGSSDSQPTQTDISVTGVDLAPVGRNDSAGTNDSVGTTTPTGLSQGQGGCSSSRSETPQPATLWLAVLVMAAILRRRVVERHRAD